MRILYVEDNPRDADLAARALMRSEVPPALLETASTLAAARAALVGPQRFDLVLTDLNLPDGNGLELLAEIRGHGLPLAVVVLTGQGDEEMVMTALRAGADDYLAKTDAFAERVPATVRAALAAHRERSARHALPLRVLYGEHGALDFDLTRRHLEAHAPHIRIEWAPDAQTVLGQLSHARGEPSDFDALLIDFRLAGDTGLDVLKTLRQERGLDLPVVLVTGQGNEEVAALAMRLGATDYVVKRDGYLLALPAVIESAFHRVRAAREQAALRALNLTLERKVTERTAELLAAKDAAEAANRGKSEFLARMSHDLRTPLNAVLGFSQLLELDAAVAASPAAAQNVRQVIAAGKHLLAMIDDLLDLARIETGGLRLTLEPVDTAALAAECVALTEPLAATRAVGVDCDCAAGDALATADRLRLRQVLVNLLSNAIKYNRQGGRVDITLSGDAQEVHIQVRDTGQGMTDVQLAGLFQPFNRVGAERSDIEGTGLGLVIALQLVQAMGGRLEVCSTPGEGTTFTIHLPRSAGQDLAAPEPQAARPGRAAVAKPARRLLYIEDNPVNVMLMQEMLALRGGVELEVASDGQGGLEAARRLRPELVLVDLDLPDMGGLDVVRRLRADPLTAHLRCVAVSAYAQPDDERRARAAGCVGYLTKPLEVSVLFAEVDRHLG